MRQERHLQRRGVQQSKEKQRGGPCACGCPRRSLCLRPSNRRRWKEQLSLFFLVAVVLSARSTIREHVGRASPCADETSREREEGERERETESERERGKAHSSCVSGRKRRWENDDDDPRVGRSRERGWLSRGPLAELPPPESSSLRPRVRREIFIVRECSERKTRRDRASLFRVSRLVSLFFFVVNPSRL